MAGLSARADDEELTGSVSVHLLGTAHCTSDCSCSVWVLQVRLSAFYYIVLLRIEMSQPTTNGICRIGLLDAGAVKQVNTYNQYMIPFINITS